MRILLDTNILLHREANRIINKDIGVLFGWFDRLHYEKCIHHLSLDEIRKYKDATTVKTIEAKIKNYRLLCFNKKKRLKIGTFKVISNGYKLGERFLKIIFDNALRNYVDEIYVTLFNKTEEQERLIGLFLDCGFYQYGIKYTLTGKELVYIKNFRPSPNANAPKLTYPFIDKKRRYFFVAIYPKYHTELFPNSILNNECPNDFVDNEPHRNAIQKVYISRSYYKNLKSGYIIVFYRTGGYYKGVVTTIGIIDKIYTRIYTALKNLSSYVEKGAYIVIRNLKNIEIL